MKKSVICHCFGYTETDIVEDFRRHGRSRILLRIQREKALGGCCCEQLNPKKR